MVGNEIQVFSKAARQEESNSTAYCWTSSGIDNFSIREAPEFQDGIGTKIVITLKDDPKKEFLDKDNVTRVIKKYSNYVGFPVMVNGDRANEVEAIWTRKAQDISDEEYDNFYKFVSGSFAPSMLRLHFQTDVPIDMKALIFCPEMHLEKMGMGRMAPGINLYSRKVLLDANSEKLLPQWMRFMKGVVDSEDLPISLSRETMQDSRLMASISKALTSRTIKLFADHAKKQPKEYNEKFYPEFGGFIKEGIVSDYNNQAAIAKLLRFNSSTINRNELTSLDDYISRCPPEQDKIYYLIAQTRKNAEESPYYELFKNQNVEVLFLYNNIDDFVMTNLQTYNGRKLINATSEEASDIDKNKKKDDEKKDDDKGDDDKKDDTNSKELVEWLSTALEGKAKKVSATTRLFGSPALVVPSESAAMRRMVKNLNAQMAEDDDDLEPQHLQINPKHKIFEQIYEMRNKDPALANEYAEGVYQSAVMAAGLSDDPAELVPKIQKLMEKLTAYQN